MCRCTRGKPCDLHLSHDECSLGRVASMVIEGRVDVEDLITTCFALEEMYHQLHYQGELSWPTS